jgi:hypothetical protein
MSLCQNPDVYYLAFPNDKIRIKCLVYGLALVEVVQTAFMSHDAVVSLGLGFGDPSALNNINFSWLTVPLTTSVGQYFKRFIATTPMFCSQRDRAMLSCMENLYSF